MVPTVVQLAFRSRVPFSRFDPPTGAGGGQYCSGLISVRFCLHSVLEVDWNCCCFSFGRILPRHDEKIILTWRGSIQMQACPPSSCAARTHGRWWMCFGNYDLQRRAGQNSTSYGKRHRTARPGPPGTSSGNLSTGKEPLEGASWTGEGKLPNNPF